jgi:hypothetical protein
MTEEKNTELRDDRKATYFKIPHKDGPQARCTNPPFAKRIGTPGLRSVFVGDFEVCGFSIVSQLGVLLPDGANSHCTYFAQIVVGQLPSGLVGPARMDFPRGTPGLRSVFVGDFEVCGFSIVSQLGVLFLGHVAHSVISV